MTSIADGSVRIQTSSESNPATPSWVGEVVVITAHLRKHDVLNKITGRVRFARRRFGHDDVIDFLAVQIALCHQRRRQPGGVLPASPAVCRPIYGASFSGISCPRVRRSPVF